MFNQKYIILFLSRGSIQLYGGNLTGIVTIEIPQAIFNDVDILRKDDLYTLIKQCVKQYALVGQLIIVLSQEIYFEKLFVPPDNPQTESDILKFFDAIPYEATWTKVYQTEKGKRAVAVNKVVYEAFHQGFILQGLSTKAVIPAFILGQMETKKVLDKPLAEYVLGNIEILAKQGLLDTQEIGSVSSQNDTMTDANKPKSKLPLLLGAFGVLIFVLFIVIATQL
jgi:hypothetical protein